MIIAYVPALFALLGLLIYLLAGRSDVKDVGRIMFFCGMLVTMMTLASKTFRLG